MRKRFVTIATTVLFIVMPLVLNAQEAASLLNSQTQYDSKALIGSAADKATLRNLLGEFTTLKASFIQTINNMQGQELQASTGELLLRKPQQLRWTVMSPEESLLVADGKTVFNVDPFVEQVTLLDQEALTKSNPLMLLITDKESQWEQVAVVQNKSSFVIVSLVADSPITELILNFGTDNKLMSIVSTDRQQQRNSLTFSNVMYDSGTHDIDFTYTPQPSWIVDDQREQASSE